MKPALATIFSFVSMIGAAYLQTENPKHENHFLLPSANTDAYSATMTDAFATTTLLDANVRINNLTVDYLIWKREESEVIYTTGTYKCEAGSFFIKPAKKITKPINLKGGTGYHVNSFSIKIGGMYRLPLNGEVKEAPDFQLPVQQPAFNAGPFLISVKGKVKQESQETVAYFTVTYNGDKFGMVRQNKLVCKIPNGTEYMNSNTDYDVEALKPGESCTVKAVFNVPTSVLDMQKTVLTIVWKDSFQESSAISLDPVTLDLEIDQAKTAAQNK
jgi:hypothetical protein